VGLTQEFTGLVEPADPDWSRAPAAVRRRYYDQAGAIVLDELRKQLEKGIGRTGRAMKPRIRPVLPDGADGPVMIPHELASRAITMSDYAATDHSLKLFWHAGTGHRQHRRARARGGKAVPFGEILRYHADGEVPHAPVRDVRLCAQRIENVRRRLGPVWARLKPQVPRTWPVGPKPKGQSFTKAQQKRFTPPPVGKIPKQTKPDTTAKAGEHPTPTHPIPVVRTLPKGRIKGPTFVIAGKGKPPPKPKAKPAPKPKPIPPPPAAPVVPFEPLPQPFYPPKPATPIEAAVAYAKSKGFEVTIDAEVFRRHYGADASRTLGFYSPKRDAIWLNPDHPSWSDPAAFFADPKYQTWFSSNHPEHTIYHEVGHGLHARALGPERFDEWKDSFASAEDYRTARKVSKYATTNTSEFVAEVYAARVAGKRYDDDVLTLYERLGGPPP
jgi:hypothetical protein